MSSSSLASALTHLPPVRNVRATRESPEFEPIVNQKKISRTRVYTPVP